MAQIANRGSGQPSATGATGSEHAARGSRSTAGSARNFSSSQRAAALDAALGDPVDAEEGTDWARVSIFSTGLALGLAVGAGVALLLAPQSGADSRDLLLRRSRRLGRHGRDAWDDLRDELHMAARRGRTKIRRTAARSAWAAEDALAERSRRRQRRRKLQALDC